jgi:hypothetical protein
LKEIKDKVMLEKKQIDQEKFDIFLFKKLKNNFQFKYYHKSFRDELAKMRNLINVEQNENSHRSFHRSFDNGTGVLESFNQRRDKQQLHQQPNAYESNMQYSLNNSKLDLESPRDFFNNERQNLIGSNERVLKK